MRSPLEVDYHFIFGPTDQYSWLWFFMHIEIFEFVTYVQILDFLSRMAVLLDKYLSIFWIDDSQKNKLLGRNVTDSFVELFKFFPSVDCASFEKVVIGADLLYSTSEYFVEKSIKKHVATEFECLFLLVIYSTSFYASVYLKCFWINLHYLAIARSSEFRVCTIN